MARLIDKDELKKAIQKNICEVMCDEPRGCSCCRVDDVWDVIYEQPTVDAVPVVRCDDCIYRDGKTAGQPNILCWQMHSDDYCSYGTKREVGTYCENIVTVVRCKDCQHFKKAYGWNGCEYTECEHFNCDVAEDGFCSWGERREDAEEE